MLGSSLTLSLCDGLRAPSLQISLPSDPILARKALLGCYGMLLRCQATSDGLCSLVALVQHGALRELLALLQTCNVHVRTLNLTANRLTEAPRTKGPPQRPQRACAMCASSRRSALRSPRSLVAISDLISKSRLPISAAAAPVGPQVAWWHSLTLSLRGVDGEQQGPGQHGTTTSGFRCVDFPRARTA